VAKQDLSSFQLRAWCSTPDHIQHHMELIIPEPTMSADVSPTKQALSYPVEIMTIAVASSLMVKGPPPIDGNHHRDGRLGRQDSRSPRHSRSPTGDVHARQGSAPRHLVHKRLGAPQPRGLPEVTLQAATSDSDPVDDSTLAKNQLEDLAPMGGVREFLYWGALGLRVYRVVGPCVGQGPTPRLYDCNTSLGIN
jgi:hypothetical protein